MNPADEARDFEQTADAARLARRVRVRMDADRSLQQLPRLEIAWIAVLTLAMLIGSAAFFVLALKAGGASRFDYVLAVILVAHAAVVFTVLLALRSVLHALKCLGDERRFLHPPAEDGPPES